MIRDVSQRRTFRRDEKITMARLLFARELMMEYGVPFLPASDGKSLERPLLNPSKPRPKTKAAPDQPMRLLICSDVWRTGGASEWVKCKALRFTAKEFTPVND